MLAAIVIGKKNPRSQEINRGLDVGCEISRVVTLDFVIVA
jgi:hypothetical protein